MKTLVRIFYLSQILASAGIMGVFGFQAIRAMFNHAGLFIVVCLCAIAVVGYKMLLIPSLHEYKEKYRK